MKSEIITTKNGSIFRELLLKYAKKLARKGDWEFFVDEFIDILLNSNVKYYNGLVLSEMVEKVDWDNFTYHKKDEVTEILKKRYVETGNSDERYFILIVLAKLIGKEAYPFLIEVIRSDEERKICAIAIKILSVLSKQMFHRSVPSEVRLWKTKDFRLEEIEAWVAGGCKDGEGFCFDKALEAPTNELEEAACRLNGKLRKKQDASDFSSDDYFLLPTEEAKIGYLKDKYALKGVYLECLTRFLSCDLNISKGMDDICLYGADNLEERQIGYSVSEQGEPLEGWPKNYLVIADRFADPYCIDTAQEDSCVYFANHGEGEWKFKKKYKNFQEFLSYLAK